MAVSGEGRVARVVHCVAAGLVAWTLVGGAGVARADGFRFAYDRGPGAESCPDADMMRARVAELTGGDLFVVDGSDTVSCVIASEDGELTADIELRSADVTSSSSRVLRSTEVDCAELAENASVIIAMVLQRSSVPAEGAPGFVEQVDDPEPLVRRPTRPAPVEVVRPSRNIPFVVGTAGALVHTSADVGITMGVAGGVRRGTYSLELELQLETSERTASETEGYVTSDSGAVAVLGCRHVGPVSGCGLASLGWIQGRGHGVMETNASTTPMFAPAHGLPGRWVSASTLRSACTWIFLDRCRAPPCTSTTCAFGSRRWGRPESELRWRCDFRENFARLHAIG